MADGTLLPLDETGVKGRPALKLVYLISVGGTLSL